MKTKSLKLLSPALAAVGLLFVGLGAVGCSPSSLFGKGGDVGVERLPSYRQVNPGCSGLTLANSQLDTDSAKQLVECLDSNGAMGGVAQLVRSMSKSELAPVVESINRNVLNDPRTLQQLERTFKDLRDQGLLADALAGLGQLLENDELLSRSLDLFKSAYAPQGTIEKPFLQALSQLSKELTHERIQDGLDLGLALADARAFSSFWSRLQPSAPSRAGTALSPEIAGGLVAYAQSSSSIVRELLQHIIDGDAFALVDQVVPDAEDGIRATVPGWGSILDASMASDGRIAGDLNSLFGALRQPILCFQGSQAMKHVPMDMLRDLSEIPSSQARAFIQRERLVELYLTWPYCTYPDEVRRYYPSLVELAGAPGIESLADLLRAAYRVGDGERRPMAEFVIRTLGDPNFRNLLPALSELSRRGTSNDLLLLATLPQVQDRAKLATLLQALLRPLPGPEARGASIHDVLSTGIARMRPQDLSAWLSSFRETTLGLGASLRAVRAAYYINDAHPVVDLLRSGMREAARDPRLLETLLRVSGRPEFRASLRELSVMARDGRMRDLLQTTLDLFHRYAAREHIEIATRAPGSAQPASRIRIRHHLSASDLPGAPAGLVGDFGACHGVDPSARWDEPSSPTFLPQLESVLACANADGQYRDLTESLSLLARERTESDASRSVYGLLMQAYNAFRFTADEARLLSRWTLAAVNDGRVLRGLRALPIWIKQDMARPLLDLADPLIADLKARSGLKRLSVYGAAVLKRPRIQSMIAHLDDLIRAEPAKRAAAPRAYDRERILRWVSNKECSTLPDKATAVVEFEAARNARMQAIIDEYENAAVHKGERQGGKLRHQWTRDDLKAELEPIFRKFGDIEGNGPLLKALFRFASRFNDPSQYPKGYLEKFLRDRARDRKLIAYIYPGEARPQVRLVNGLDRLGLVLSDADLYIEEIGMNFGMFFLSEIANAWGDVPYEQRPAEIQAKYPPDGEPCPTLADAVRGILDTARGLPELMGLPDVPVCVEEADPRDPPEVQAAETSNPQSATRGTDKPLLVPIQLALYNINQTVDVLQENLDNGGIRLLRDLFFDLYYTGPAENRNPGAGLKNNLSVVISLVRAGLLRQAGLLMQDTDGKDPLVSGFFQALQDGAASPRIEEVASRLFVDDKEHELIWKVIGEITDLHDPVDIAHAKAIGFHALATIDSLGKVRTGAQGRNELLDPLLKFLSPILAEYRPFLVRNADLVGDLIRSGGVADFLVNASADRDPIRGSILDLALDALSQEQRGLDLMAALAAVDSNDKAHRSWDRFKDGWKRLDTLPEWKALELRAVGRQLLNFVEGRDERGPLPASEAAIGRKLLLQLAEAIERGDGEFADELLAFIRRRPEDTHRLIQALSGLVEGGELPRLLELVKKVMEPTG